jgi:NADPH-dependent curcumin reductase CurA
MPGFTAYGGLRVIGEPQAGETVMVGAASGPVGSLSVSSPAFDEHAIRELAL